MPISLILDPITGKAVLEGLTTADVWGSVSKQDLASVLAQIDLINQRLEEIELALQNTTNNAGRLEWVVVTGTAQAISPNTAYLANNAALVTLTLPATASIGSVIEIAGMGVGGWKIAQNAGQTIRFGNKTSTAGTGSLNSTHQADSVRLVCSSTDTAWQVLGAVGNLDIL
jgi:hypothetical protein